MKMQRINIKNFKKFEDVTVEFNPDVNVFTGINNCGKTTLLEAIALWHECFVKLIKQADRGDKKLNLRQGDYRLGNKSQNYYDFNEIVSVRSPNYEDLFYNLDTGEKVYIQVDFLTNGSETLKIGFYLCSVSGNNYEIHVNQSVLDYTLFNSFFKSFPCPISSIYASPVAHLLFDEEFERDAVIKYKIQRRKSIEAIRNRLYQINQETRVAFTKDLSKILNNNTTQIEYKIIGEYNKDISIKVEIKLSAKDVFKDISLLGSGTLQIIEILLSIYDEIADLKVILLDEPDSHIHRDIQKRLLEVLVARTKNTQIFITTHNESLIRSAHPNFIFHLENTAKKVYEPIGGGISTSNRQGFQETYKLKILKELGGESSLDFINALEADKLVFVEGLSDAKYLDVLMGKKYIDDPKKNVMYWSFDGVDNLLLNIKAYKSIFSNIKNEKTLWDKSLIVMDSDWFTKTQRDQLKTEMNKVGPTVIWSCYTFESVLLTDLYKLSSLLFDYVKNQDEHTKKLGDIDDSNSGAIQEKLQEIIKEKCQKMLAEIDKNDNDFEKKVKEWQGKKKNVFTKSDIYKQYNDSDYHKYYSFLKKELNDDHYSVIATKDDVREICEEVLRVYGINLDGQRDIVYELLRLVSSATWYEQWEDLFKPIYNEGKKNDRSNS